MQSFLNFLAKINKKEYSPFYLLSGNESFFIDRICDSLIENLVKKTLKILIFLNSMGKKHSF